MADDDIELVNLYEKRQNRYRILVCVDGSEESYRGLGYAAEIASNKDSDIILLYVRPIDQGLRSGGLQIRVARENMLSWGLELPGIKYLKKGLEQLMSGVSVSDDWHEKTTHTDIAGDPLGDNKIEYTNEDGQTIVLKLKTASTIPSGILDQYKLGPYDLIILGASSSWRGWVKKFWDPSVARKVAMYAPCSVLVAKGLERGHGHLLCTDGSERALKMIRRSAKISLKINSKLSIVAVSQDAKSESKAQKNVDIAVTALKAMGVNPVHAFTRVGDPFEEIISAGEDYSFIVLGSTKKTGLGQNFFSSLPLKVIEHAKNSVIIVR
jgi:nucleotide-binding universal stress UspA family protein